MTEKQEIQNESFEQLAEDKNDNEEFQTGDDQFFDEEQENLNENDILFDFEKLFVLSKTGDKENSSIKTFFDQLMAKNINFVYERKEIILNIESNIDSNSEYSQYSEDSDEDEFDNSPNAQDVIALIHYQSDPRLKIILADNLLQMGIPVPLVTPDQKIHCYQFIQSKFKDHKTQQYQNLFEMNFGVISFMSVCVKEEENHNSSDMIGKIFQINRKDLNWSECNQNKPQLTEKSITMDVIDNIKQLAEDLNFKKKANFEIDNENYQKVYIALNLEGSVTDFNRLQCQFLLEKSAIVCLFCNNYERNYELIKTQLNQNKNCMFVIISRKKINSKQKLKSKRIQYVILKRQTSQGCPLKILKILLKQISKINNDNFANMKKFSDSLLQNEIQNQLSQNFKRLEEMFVLDENFKEKLTYTKCLPKCISDLENNDESKKIYDNRKKQKINISIEKFMNFLIDEIPKEQVKFASEFIGSKFNIFSQGQLQPLLKEKIKLMNDQLQSGKEKKEIEGLSGTLQAKQEQIKEQKRFQDQFKEDLIEKQKEIQKRALGLEHIYREIYNYIDVKFDINDGNCHELIEKLIDNKIPIELLDGDHFFVCKNVVQNIVNYMKKQIGNERVLVLSVLGVQSSGKSTLLNSMFNLNFLVSEGRCTRGANLQILKVDEEESRYKYILLIDTEGLASPSNKALSKDSYGRDNKLASFVISLSDLVLINIYGENSKSIIDILPIVGKCVVDLSLSYSEISKLIPKLMFIHQATNIETINIEIQNENREKIEQIKRILKQIIKSSNPNIDDDPNLYLELNYEDIHYFSQYKKNGKISAEYSKDCQDLKNKILTCEVKNQTAVDTFKKRFDIVWEGINTGIYYFDYSSSMDMQISLILRNIVDEKRKQFQIQIQKLYVQKQNEVDYYLYDQLYEDQFTQLQDKYKEECHDLQVNFQENFLDTDIEIPDYVHSQKDKINKYSQEFKNLCKEVMRKKNQLLRIYYENKSFTNDIDRKKLFLESQLFNIIIECKNQNKNDAETTNKVDQQISNFKKTFSKQTEIITEKEVFKGLKNTKFYQENQMLYKKWKVDSSFQLIELEKKIDKDYLYNKHRTKDDQAQILYELDNLNGNQQKYNEDLKNCCSFFNIILKNIKKQQQYDPQELENMSQKLLDFCQKTLDKEGNKKKQTIAILYYNLYFEAYKIYQKIQVDQQNTVNKKVNQIVEQIQQNTQKMINETDTIKKLLIRIENTFKNQFIDQLEKQIDLSCYLQVGSKYQYIFISICYIILQNNFRQFLEFQTDQKTNIIEIISKLVLFQFSEEKPDLHIIKNHEKACFQDLIDTCAKEDNIENFIKIYNKKVEQIKKYQIKSFIENKSMIDRLKDNKVFETFKDSFRNFRNIPDETQFSIGKKQIENFVKNYVSENFGCTERCPLCQNICEDTRKDTEHEHRCQFHYSGYVAGIQDINTKEADTLNCIQNASTNYEFRCRRDKKWYKYKDYKKCEAFKNWTLDKKYDNNDINQMNSYIGHKWKQHFEAYYCYPAFDKGFKSTIQSDSEFFNKITRYIQSESILKGLRFLARDKKTFNNKVDSVK